jgi:acyl-CoA synthetase (AMP-forming)/AMP-acid ligase II
MVIPKRRTVDAVLSEIVARKVNLLPTTPSFLRMLMVSGVYDQYDLSSLKLITYGTEPMDQALLAKLIETFPNIEFKQTYGLTETGILSTKGRDKTSLEMKINEATRVVDGCLQIKADTAMLGYLNYPSPFTDDGWYMTGDRVEVDGEYMRIVGRDSDFINVGGEKINPITVEEAVCSLPDIDDCAAFGVANELLGQTVGIKVWTEIPDARILLQLIRKELRDKLPKKAIPTHIEIDNKPLISNRMKKLRR